MVPAQQAKQRQGVQIGDRVIVGPIPLCEGKLIIGPIEGRVIGRDGGELWVRYDSGDSGFFSEANVRLLVAA